MKQYILSFCLLFLLSCKDECRYAEPSIAETILTVNLLGADEKNVFETGQYDLADLEVLCSNQTPIDYMEKDPTTNEFTFKIPSCGDLVFGENDSLKFVVRLDSLSEVDLLVEYRAKKGLKCGGTEFEYLNVVFNDSTYSLTPFYQERLNLMID